MLHQPWLHTRKFDVPFGNSIPNGTLTGDKKSKAHHKMKELTFALNEICNPAAESIF